MYRLGGLSADEKEAATDRITDLEDQLQQTQAALDEETGRRVEAEDWANVLIDELDQTNIQLDEARETLAAGEAEE